MTSPHHRAPVHRAIVVVDVEEFAGRSANSQLAMREWLDERLRAVLEDAHIPLNECEFDHTGDGHTIIVQPSVPGRQLTDQLPHRLRAELRRYNEVRSEQARIRLRMSVHAGQVSYGANGPTGRAVILAHRLVNSQELRMTLKSSPGVLALIASDHFFHEVVLQDPASEPETYSKVQVVEKETRVVAWIRAGW